MIIKNQENAFFRDAGWYLIGSFIPIIINLIKTPILTSHFSTKDFGYLGLVMTTFGYLSTMTYAWLASCLWRFYNVFDRVNNRLKLYTNVLLLYGFVTIFTLICTVIIVSVGYYLGLSKFVLGMVAYTFLHFSIKELLGLYMITLRLKGMTKAYNIILISQVLLGFIMLMIMVFELGMNISSVLISAIVIDSLFLVSIYLYLKDFVGLKIFSRILISKRVCFILYKFGSTSIISSLLLLLIVSSDRYIVAFYDTISNVGIYSKVYDISQLSIASITFVYFSTIAQKMSRELSINIKNVNGLMSKYLYGFLIFGIPITFLASIYSKEISDLLLGESFRDGHRIMPYIFFSTFIYGVIRVFENKLWYSKRMLVIIKIFAFSFILNISLNIYFVQMFGYMAAAIITLLTYEVMLICFILYDSLSFFQHKRYLKNIAGAILLMTALWIVDSYLRSYIDFQISHAIIEGMTFLLIYLLLFYKEIKTLVIPL